MDNIPKHKTLIVIAGPTAVGKTDAAISLAQGLNTKIVSADSRQFYREMSIGTAKPSVAELQTVKHHFIDSHSVSENFSVGDFEKEGLRVIDGLLRDHDAALLVGGSGLYIKAICEGFDELPIASAGIRERLNTEFDENGIGHLQEKIKLADPVYAAQVDMNNPQRLIRALEVTESTGKPFSSYRKSTINARPFNIIKVGLNLPRDILYSRINQRVDAMIRDGLVDEVRSLLPFRHLNALNTVGYSEIFDYLDGKTDLETAIEQIKQNTRRFAKRQLTWFGKDKEIIWIDAANADLLNLVKSRWNGL